MQKLGFTHKQAKQLYFGYWYDLFSVYKKHYNFETKRVLYRLEEDEEPVSSLSVL